MTTIKIPSSNWSETEKQVAETLRDLYRISLFSSVPFSWRCKRKRSKPSSLPNKRYRRANPTAAVDIVAILRRAKATSPTTPLSYPATESDDKLKRSKKKISLKKEKEASLKTIQDLTNTQASIRQEIEIVKNHYDQLKSFNLKLKLRKQQLLCGARTTSDLNSKLKSPNLEIGKNDQAIGLVNNSTKSTAENEEQKKQENQHHGPSDGPSSSVGLGRNRGPIDIPDLNLPSEDFIEGVAFQPLDETTRKN
ncbi:uncharacterized protein LOC131594213 [Vicia villosa]|uniref:uncharacterized protein LOC131594213 n=1 Tax=Vicia villosa TaxID=3911 RepID=UPI00273AA64E|nr:uncharacterized protein LOC131594213 [Vicia villosa]